MVQRIKLNPEVTPARLDEALKAPLSKEQHRRVVAMQLALEGKLKAADIAKTVGISRAQFFCWKKLDLQGLLHIGRGGRTPRLSPLIQQQMQQRIKKGESAAEIQFWLNGKKVGIKIKTGGVYYYMKKLGPSATETKQIG